MNDSDTRKIKRNLREVFGLEKLRPGQKEVINHVLNGEDVLAIMPTGAGKSLCYQLPALQLKGMTVVISPLISLMKDQTDKLEEKGLEVANLNSSISESEQREALETIENEQSEFIFTTPERLANPEFLETIVDKQIDFVVIDEAHCISQWGHDFRPAFLELREVFKRLKNPPILALTATATPEVVEDIKKQLERPQLKVINAGIYRPNLIFEVVHATSDSEKKNRLIQILEQTAGSKIIYCATVKAVEEVAGFLRSAGIEAESYHGKLSPKTRREAQDRFMNGQTETIVATNAFGMGVDKPDIRAVIHWQISGSLEAYYQEAGRAGRDDENARCILLYDTRDRRIQQFFLGGRYPSADDVSAVYQALTALNTANNAASVESVKETAGDAITKTKLRVALNLLKDAGVVKEHRGAKFSLLRKDLDQAKIVEIAAEYENRGETDREKLEKMMLYAQSALCRWHILSEYFEAEKETEEAKEVAEKCGVCDNCANPIEERLGIETEAPVKFDERILEQIKANNPAFEKGETVETKANGAGKITEINGDKITVKFPGGAKKTFKKDYLKKNYVEKG